PDLLYCRHTSLADLLQTNHRGTVVAFTAVAGAVTALPVAAAILAILPGALGSVSRSRWPGALWASAEPDRMRAGKRPGLWPAPRSRGHGRRASTLLCHPGCRPTVGHCSLLLARRDW